MEPGALGGANLRQICGILLAENEGREMSGGAEDSVMHGGHCYSLPAAGNRDGGGTPPPQESDLHTQQRPAGLHGAQEEAGRRRVLLV